VSLSHIVIAIFCFVVGLAFGSFLNVCIARLPKGESVVSPRSRCPGCRAPIRWYDNVPLLSWLLLRGRCRDCGASISWHYPAVELATAAWFVIAASRVPFDAVSTMTGAHFAIALFGAVSFAVLGFLLIGLMVMDWQTGLLPDAFTFGGIAAGLFLVCSHAIFLAPGEDQVILNSTKQLRLRSPGSFAAQGNVFLTGPESLIYGRVVAACGVALLLLSIRWAYKALRKRDGVGLGDIKMLAMIAAFLGFWPALLALFIGFVTAACYSVALIARGQANASTRIAFGSFLGFGGLISAVFGSQVIAWYATLLR
jgi:leader peptidase (prepilin peptidase)/N-methyltransferase